MGTNVDPIIGPAQPFVELEDVRFPASPVAPGGVSWSGDNRLLVVTPSTLFILTPTQLRLGAEASHFHSVRLRRRVADDEISEGVLSRKKTARIDDPPDAFIIRKGMDPPGFKTACWSPTGCSKHFGCLLSAIVDEGQFLIYEPSANPATSDWSEIDSIAKYYQKHTEELLTVEPPLATSIAWSHRYAVWDSQAVAIVAIGNKDGGVQMWEFRSELKLCAEFHAQHTRVTHLAWSQWIRIAEEERHALLAVACSEGSVQVWKIRITIDELQRTSYHPAELVVGLFKKDMRPCTVMYWYDDLASLTSRLAFAKGTLLYIWNAQLLEEELLPPNANALLTYYPECFMPISGLSWTPDGNHIYLIALDGRCLRVLRVTSDRIEVDETASKTFSDDLLHRCSRRAEKGYDSEEEEDGEGETFEKDEAISATENRDSVRKESEDTLTNFSISSPSRLEPRFYGACLSFNGVYTAVLYTFTNPFHLVYRAANLESSFLSFVHHPNTGTLTETLQRRLPGSTDITDWMVGLRSPQYRYWDILDAGNYNDKHGGDITERNQFVQVYRSLFGALELLVTPGESDTCYPAYGFWAGASIAMRDMYFVHHQLLAFDRFHTQTALSPEDLGRKHSLLTNVATAQLNRLLLCVEHWLAVTTSPLSDLDRQICRLALQSITLLPKSARALVSSASNALHRRWKKGKYASRSADKSSREVCLVCGCLRVFDVTDDSLDETSCFSSNFGFLASDCSRLLHVPFESLDSGTCEKGHRWFRCTASLLLAGIPPMRTCITCNAKTLDQQHLLEFADSDADLLAHVLKQTAPVCVRCGSGFYDVLGAVSVTGM